MNGSLAEQIALLPPEEHAKFLKNLSPDEAKYLQYDWRYFWARPKQLAPSDLPKPWAYWLVLAGRGFGKTRTGAEWVIEQVRDHGAKRIALVGSTAADVRDVMIEASESGIMACSPPWFRPKYEPSKRRLTWPNGATATTYGAEEPEQLRGPQHEKAWCDELAKWRYPDAWDQLVFGLRLGKNPQACVTTTPKPVPIVKKLIADPLTVITRGSTSENAGNLAPRFLDHLVKKYKGTRLGRQELDAELLDDAPGALWKRAHIERNRRHKAPRLLVIAVAVDPSVSAVNPDAETGIVAVGLGEDRHLYVLADATLIKPSPKEWAQAAVATYNKLEANFIVGEVNNGGDLVESNITTLDPKVPFEQVRASRGKAVRAEPVAMLSEQDRLHHVGFFPELEDELTQWEPGVTLRSPNRLDALVWACTVFLERMNQGAPIKLTNLQNLSRWERSGRGFG